jgi:hypothetical protein
MLAAPAGEVQTGKRHVRVCDRFADRARLCAERLRRGELAGENMDARLQVERQWQHGQRAGIARELDLPSGEHEPALVVPQIHGGAAREPQPANPLLAGEFFAAERAQCPLQHRRPRAVALRLQESQPVEEEIGRSRGLRRRGRPACGIGNLPHTVAAAQATGVHRRGQSLQVGMACETGVERLESFGGLQQQRRRVTAATHDERDLGA